MRFCEADRIESIRRMKEIDDIRANGGQTEYEKIIDKELIHKGHKKTIVINCRTKTVNEYNSIKEACKSNNIEDWIIRNKFRQSGSNKVLHNGLVFKKVDKEKKIETVNTENHLKPWTDEDIAYMVQRRPEVQWKSIAAVIGKTVDACSEKYRDIKKEGKLSYYMNYKLESIKW